MYYIIDTKKFANIIADYGLMHMQNLNDYISVQTDNRYVSILSDDSIDNISCHISLVDNNSVAVTFCNYKEIFTVEYDYNITIKKLHNPYIIKTDISIEDEKVVDIFDIVIDSLRKSVVKKYNTKYELFEWINSIIDTVINN